MNKKWSEKTAFEKTLDVIAFIAICVWLVFEIMESRNAVPYAELGSCISIGVVCACEAISFWNVKRALSYVAIAGALLMFSALIIQSIPVS